MVVAAVVPEGVAESLPVRLQHIAVDVPEAALVLEWGGSVLRGGLGQRSFHCLRSDHDHVQLPGQAVLSGESGSRCPN